MLRGIQAGGKWLLAIILLAAALTMISCRDKKDKNVSITGSLKPVVLPHAIPGVCGDLTYSCLIVDSNNVVHIAWKQDFDTPYYWHDIFYVNSLNWSAVANVSQSDDAIYPFIAVDSSDMAYIVWSEYVGTSYNTFIANSNDWTGSRTNLSNNDLGWCPIITVDCNDTVHAMWQEGGWSETFFVYANSTDWAATKETIVGPIKYLGGYDIKTDSQGVVHVAIAKYDIAGTHRDIWYANSTDWPGTWTNASQLSQDSSFPMMMVDSNDVVHIFWDESLSQLYHANSTDWAATRELVPVHGSWPNIAIDSKDIIHMVFDRGDIFYCNSTDWVGTFMAVSTTFDAYLEFPSIAVDSKDAVHIIWEEDYGGTRREIWYTQLAR